MNLTPRNFIKIFRGHVERGDIIINPDSTRSAIRCRVLGEREYHYCPVTAVCRLVTGAVYHETKAFTAGHRLGMLLRNTALIMEAADTDDDNNVFRRLLLGATESKKDNHNE